MTPIHERIQMSTPVYYRALVALFIGGVVAFGLEYCVQPIIPILAEEFGLSPTRASLAVTFGTGGMALAMIAIGMYAKRMRRRYTMYTALVGAIVLAVGISVCPYFEGVLAMRVLQGILLAGFPAMAIAYINEEFDTCIVATTVGVYISGTSIGGLLGRFILSSLTDYMKWSHALLVLCSVYAILTVVFIWLLPREQFVQRQLAKAKDEGEQERLGFYALLSAWKDKSLRPVLGMAMLVMGAFVCTYNFITYVLIAEPYNWSKTTVGLVYFLYLLGTCSSTTMGLMADRWGNRKAFIAACLAMLVGLLISSFIPTVWKLVGIGTFTFGFFGAHSTACSWAGKVGSVDKGII